METIGLAQMEMGLFAIMVKALEKMSIPDVSSNFRVLEILEDKAGNLWFATSEGLINSIVKKL